MSMRIWGPFLFGLGFAATPWCSSAMALSLGLLFSLLFSLTLPSFLKLRGKYIMQFAIVMMGFAMEPQAVMQSGIQGASITFVTLVLALTVGWCLSRVFRLEGTTGTLISAGTGICGGSAIACLSPVLKSTPDEVAVSMATVFCLNAVALFIFPAIGHLLHLTPEQFGWFAAIAIHDTSSVVGAATEYHPASVAVAVTGKLTRALWIIPLVISAAALMRWRSHKQDQGVPGKVQWPWFIGLFSLAVLVHSLLPPAPDLYHVADVVGKAALKMAIFLIGAQLTRTTLKAVGTKAIAVAVLLWVVMATFTVAWVQHI